MEIYVVKAGDNIDGIASEFGVAAERIIYVNQLVYPYELAVGQALLILEDDETGADGQHISVSGYAYPFISSWVLDQTLPYLTDLNVFSYGFTEDGELLPPSYGEDDWMIERALALGVNPVLTLTPFGRDGMFSNMLINAMLNNEYARETLIRNLILKMQAKGYRGVDIDFEYILPEDKELFSEFVGEVADAARMNGFYTSVALAPKTSSDQKGLLYEGKDYRAIGENADFVLLMTYEWGYTYGPPMAVAPINQVRKVVEYAITEIPTEKINLGIPNYGYDWPLPYIRGTTKASTINNVQAVRIAIQYGATIMFDETAKSPYFRYMEGETLHEVWFEDVRSLYAKFDIIKEFNLRGCSYWTIMQWFRANWELLSTRFTII